MNLIVITRKVDKNDSRAGFMVGWLNAISERVSNLYVISWQEGSAGGLFKNVHLLSLSGSKLKKVLQCELFLLKYMRSVDGVLTLQNPEYAMLAAPFVKIFRKKLVSWYAHGAVTIRRRIMEIFANAILTSSERGFRSPLFFKKVRIIGQGIDVAHFTSNVKNGSLDEIRLLTVGRIAPTKDIESMIQALSELKSMSKDRWTLFIIGTPANSVDIIYLKNLKQLVNELGITDYVKFVGGVTWAELPKYYQNAHIFLNMSGTGSLDKAVLEAMASECFVLTSNDAFKNILPPECIAPSNNPKALAQIIFREWALPERRKREIIKELRDYVVRHHNVANFAER